VKTGVIDVGGGLRGIYAAGIFDYCMDKGIQFALFSVLPLLAVELSKSVIRLHRKRL